MITRFRVEGRHQDKDKLSEQLFESARAIQIIARTGDDPDGSWEITDERIEGKPGNYRGRMVFVFAEGVYV